MVERIKKTIVVPAYRWYSASSRLPIKGQKVIVQRYDPDFGMWEQESAWGGRRFLCELYGESKVIRWRKKTEFDR